MLKKTFFLSISSSCEAVTLSGVLFYLFFRTLGGDHVWLMGLVVWEVKLLVSELDWATTGEGEVEIRGNKESRRHTKEREKPWKVELELVFQ